MKYFVACAILFSGLAACSSATAATKKVPNELLGSWEVIAVRVDEEAGPYKLRYVPNDLRFMGINLVIAADSVNEDLTLSCERPEWRKRKSTWSRALNLRSFRRVPTASFPKGEIPKPESLGFNSIKLGDPVVEYSARCEGKSEGQPRNLSLFMSPNNSERLYAHFDEGFLVFRRHAANEKPRASFACVGELTATRQTICGSFGLAARDRAAMKLWQYESEGAKTFGSVESVEKSKRRAEVQKEQSKWLAEREICKNDVACISKKLQERLDVVSTEQYNEGNRDPKE
jgi:hypothetical protein